MNQELIKRVVQRYVSAFGTKPELLIKSPGRINVIGEHTDYNNGFVLPGAIDKAIYFAVGLRTDSTHHLIAIDKDQQINIPILDFEKKSMHWTAFLIGGLFMYHTHVETIDRGYNIVFSSDLPIGAGLSSSSALSCGAIYAIDQLQNRNLSRREVALLGHRVERQYVGLNGGIMDQFANMLCKKDQVLLIDCDDQGTSNHALELGDYQFLLINSKVDHQLTESDYNVRAHESQEAVDRISTIYPEVNSLRDVTISMLDELKIHLGEMLHQRASFVLSENQRVQDLLDASRSQNIERVGTLLNESHAGLRDDYPISCTEIDFLQEKANEVPGVLGSRIMGGGFGGCTINLVKNRSIPELTDIISKSYLEQYGIEPEFIPVVLADGTSLIKGDYF